MGGVYVILNKVNNKKYIGKSINIKSRWANHISSLRMNKHYNTYLQNAWNKYGEENFSFKVLCYSDDNEELNRKEKFYIKVLRSMYNEEGYNLTHGGDSYMMSEETKEKMKGLGSKLSNEDVRRIKLLLFCLMDRREIAKQFNVSVAVISAISQGKNFSYVSSELNPYIFNVKQKLIEERNEKILALFDKGITITNISRKTGLSASIVEKCIYKHRNPQDENKKYYQKIYDEVYRLYGEGVNKYQISKQLNISPSTVSRYLNNENNPYR